MLNLESYSQIVYTCHTYSLPNRSTSPYCLPLAPTTQWRKAAWQPTRTLFTTRQLYKVIAYIYIYTYKYTILIYTCAHIIYRYIYILYIYDIHFFCTAISWRIIKDKIKFAILIHTPHKTWPAWSLSMTRISIYNAIWRPHLISTRSEEWELFPSPQTSLHMTVWHTLQLITSHFPEGNALQKATSSSLGWSQQMIS